MNVTKCSWRSLCVVMLVTASAAGCASWRSPIPKAEDISGKRRERSEAAARQLERKRNRAEIEAAQACWAQGDVQGCIEGLKSILARNPGHPEAGLLIAESLLAANRPKEAIGYLEPALAAHADDPRLHHMMGVLSDATGQTGNALAFYEQAAQLEPHNEVYAVSYQMLVPDPSGADDLTRPALPERFVAQGEDAGSSEPAGFAEASSLPEGAVGASAAELFAKGSSAMSNGKSDLAFAYFRDAIVLEPDDPQIPTSAAVCALQHNQPDVAISLLEPLLTAFSDSAAIRRVLGAAYYRLGDYESSQVVLQQALSLDNSSPLSYFLMGCTLVKLGQPAVAEAHFRQAQRLDPRYAFQR